MPACCLFRQLDERLRETTRRVVVELPSNWPYLHHFQHVSQRILAATGAAFNTS